MWNYTSPTILMFTELEAGEKAMAKRQYLLYAILLILAWSTFVFFRFHFRGHVSEVSPKTFQPPMLTPPYDWSQQSSTAVIAIRDGCHFCEDSASFYRRLVYMEQQREIKTHIVFVLPDSQSIGRSDIPTNAAESQVFYNVPLRSFGVTGTPTILIVSNSEQIVRVWQGELTPDEENKAISFLK
jgi:hypothetical protein